ncbi:hypothetical protein CFAM422_007136 [Trichoderma lentiforme]|uniref:Uncharacterized protein n=1 Tax=Trichoderma lentiforme TaxID=1567552 RepID=A0A9P4XDH1_9HYPO|nr:hypothetical protein CFAM422_007136 [Trichoderma lentiforme]
MEQIDAIDEGAAVGATDANNWTQFFFLPPDRRALIRLLEMARGAATHVEAGLRDSTVALY